MGAVAYDVILGSMTISQVESSGVSQNAVVSRGRETSGTISDALYLDKSEPVGSFSSSDRLPILGGINLTTGLCLSSPTITIPFAKQGCSGNLGAGNHFAISGTNGFAHIQSITGSTSDARAMATVECCILSSDGFTTPYTISETANLASNAFIGEYRMQKVTKNGTAVTGLTAVTINPGVNYSKRSTDGGIYPTHTYLDRIDPSIDLTFENQAAFNSFGPIFSDNTALIVYFAAKSDGGSLVSGASSAHIAISFGDNLGIAEAIRGQGRTPAEVTIKIHGKSLSVSTTSTIP